jgi:hypothetical protein
VFRWTILGALLVASSLARGWSRLKISLEYNGPTGVQMVTWDCKSVYGGSNPPDASEELRPNSRQGRGFGLFSFSGLMKLADLPCYDLDKMDGVT